MSESSNKSRAKQLKMRKTLLLMWAIFIPVLIVVIIFFVKNKDEVMEDMGLKEAYVYEVDANPEINQLIRNYFTAYAACDQMTLKSLVVDPSQYDDMTIVEKKASVVTGYNNIKCYTIQGLTEDATVVYVVANISIANVVSTPLDMNPALYVVKKDGKYLIDNSALSKEVSDYIASMNQKADIQDLMQMVKDDQEKCVAQDETFRIFYNRLTDNQSGSGQSSEQASTEAVSSEQASSEQASTEAASTEQASSEEVSSEKPADGAQE